MNYLFDRKATLRIGKAGQTGILIDGLRVAFEITKTSTSESNTCNVTVSNLSDNSQALLKADEGVLVELAVGYNEAGNTEVIFVGDITNVYTNNTKPDVTTVITLEDGYGAIKAKRFSNSYKSGTKLDQIIKDLAKAMGLPEKTRLSLVNIPSVTFNAGYAFEGYVADAMDRLCGDNGLEWSVQNNELKITTKAGTDNSATLSTTLIGSPKRVHTKPKGDSTAEEFIGWEMETLLAAKAEPGGAIWLESVKVSPAVKLKIVEVRHVGDTHGDRWTSMIKAKEL